MPISEEEADRPAARAALMSFRERYARNLAQEASAQVESTLKVAAPSDREMSAGWCINFLLVRRKALLATLSPADYVLLPIVGLGEPLQEAIVAATDGKVKRDPLVECPLHRARVGVLTRCARCPWRGSTGVSCGYHFAAALHEAAGVDPTSVQREDE